MQFSPVTIFHKLKDFILSENLLGKSLRGSGILAMGSFLESLARFARNIILARILAPDAFGLMATIISSIAVIESLTQVGMRQSTIQNKFGGEEGFLNVVWWISFLRGLSIYVIAFFASPYISSYFGRPESVYILRTGFLVLLINGLISPRTYILEKKLQFQKWVLIMQGSGIIGTVTAIGLAFVLKNVWALVLGFITESFLRTILSFILCPIKPKIKWDKVYAIETLQFSKRMFGLPLIMMLYGQIDVFIVGKVLSVKHLGTYVLVKSLAEMPADLFSKIIQPVTLPVFSSMQENRPKLTDTLLSVTRVMSLFMVPFTAFLFLFAEPLLKIIYGYEYSKLAVPFGILCIATLIMLISSLIVQVYFAMGRPDMHRTASLVRTITFLILVYPATKFIGLTGTALAALTAIFFLILTQMIYARKAINLHTLDYLNKWLPGLQASLIVIIPGIIIKYFFTGTDIVFLLIGITLCLAAWFYAIYKADFLRMLHGERSG